MIYVITHKKIKTIKEEGYKTLLVGADVNNTFSNDYEYDNVGENISAYNDSYCELTGLYWIWKNAKENIVGLVHYRRLFVNLKPHIDFLGRHVVLAKNDPYTILNNEDVNKLLKNHDLIVKRSEFRLRTVKQIFIKQIGMDLFEKVKKTIYVYEKDYVDSFNRICNSHSHINCNMFIGKKEIIDRYCEWLFPLLNDIDQQKIEESGDRYHNREIGYISELLFGVWLKNNYVKYIAVPVVFTENQTVANGVLSIKEFCAFLFGRAIKAGE